MDPQAINLYYLDSRVKLFLNGGKITHGLIIGQHIDASTNEIVWEFVQNEDLEEYSNTKAPQLTSHIPHSTVNWIDFQHMNDDEYECSETDSFETAY